MYKLKHMWNPASHFSIWIFNNSFLIFAFWAYSSKNLLKRVVWRQISPTFLPAWTKIMSNLPLSFLTWPFHRHLWIDNYFCFKARRTKSKFLLKRLKLGKLWLKIHLSQKYKTFTCATGSFQSKAFGERWSFAISRIFDDDTHLLMKFRYWCHPDL